MGFGVRLAGDHRDVVEQLAAMHRTVPHLDRIDPAVEQDPQNDAGYRYESEHKP